MPRLAARRRPALPMTPKQHARTSYQSCIRFAAAERSILEDIGGYELLEQLDLAVMIALEAIDRMDEELGALPKGKNPFVWPVFEEERQLMDRIYGEQWPVQKRPGVRTQ